MTLRPETIDMLGRGLSPDLNYSDPDTYGVEAEAEQDGITVCVFACIYSEGVTETGYRDNYSEETIYDREYTGREITDVFAYNENGDDVTIENLNEIYEFEF